MSLGQEQWFIGWIDEILHRIDSEKIVDVMIYSNERLMTGFLARKRSLEEESKQRLWRVPGPFEIENARACMKKAWMCDVGSMGVSGK